MKVILVRHAKIDRGNGIVQAEDDHIIVDEDTMVKVDKAQVAVSDSDVVFCSDLNRAKETVKLLFPNRKDIVYSELLREYVRPSRFVGKDKKELVNFWEVEHKQDRYDPFWKPEDGESYFECASRAEKFYRKLLEVKETGVQKVVVVGHGTLFRHLVCALVGVDWKENPRIGIDLLRSFSWDNLESKNYEI